MRIAQRVVAPMIVVAALLLAGCAPSESGTATVSGTVTVFGTIRSPDGNPRADCTVTVSTITGPPVPEIAQVTNDQGGYSWTLPSGTFRLQATCDGDEGSATVDTTDQSRHEDIDIIVSLSTTLGTSCHA